MHGSLTATRPRLPCVTKHRVRQRTLRSRTYLRFPLDDMDWAPPCRKGTASASSRGFWARFKRIHVRFKRTHF